MTYQDFEQVDSDSVNPYDLDGDRVHDVREGIKTRQVSNNRPVFDR